jgi:hypothetical protein
VSLLSLLAATDYSYSYSTTSAGPAANAAVMAVILTIAIISGLIGYALSALFLSFIFKKAGVEKWKAWVPVYRMWVMYELGGQAGWWAIILLIPVVNIVALVFMYIAMYDIGLKLGKTGVFVLWAIFLPIVWYIWLAFDQSRWDPAAGATTVGNAPAGTSVPPTAAV